VNEVSQERFLDALVKVRTQRVMELEEANALQRVMIEDRDARIAELEASEVKAADE
jgi:hypothetical protein